MHVSNRTLLQLRRQPCGDSAWVLEFDRRGAGQCAFCAARAAEGRSGEPVLPRQQPEVIGQRVREALFRHRHRRNLSWVKVNPDADAFVPEARDLRDATFAAIQVLLARGIGVHLATRGGLGDAEGLVTLARRYPGQVAVDVGVFAMDRKLSEAWERGCAPVGARLDLASALAAVGGDVTVVLGPIVPFVNDEQETLRRVVRSVAQRGLRRIRPSWPANGPGLTEQVAREVSRSTAKLLQGHFRMRGAAHRAGTRAAVPDSVRRPTVEALRELCAKVGVQLVVCQCVLADGPDSCLGRLGDVPTRAQLDLFGQTG